MKLCREIIISLIFSVIYVFLSLIFWFEIRGTILLLLLFMLIGIFVVFIYLVMEFVCYKIKTRRKSTIEGTISSQEPDNFIGFRKLFSQNKYGGEAE